MICNRCGAVCGDQDNVCYTCGEPLEQACELVKTPQQEKNEQTGRILGILSIVCAPLAFITAIIGYFCCLGWMGYIIHAAGIIMGIIGVIIGGDQKKLGIIGVIVNIAMVVIPIIVALLLYVLAILGVLSMEALYYV